MRLNYGVVVMLNERVNNYITISLIIVFSKLFSINTGLCISLIVVSHYHLPFLVGYTYHFCFILQFSIAYELCILLIVVYHNHFTLPVGYVYHSSCIS